MPPPIAVDLRPHDPAWPGMAAREMERIETVFGGNLVDIHHIGSTAIPGISAKPILDLMPVLRNLASLDDCREALEGLGYEWWGELGIAGRRYCTFSDLATNRRLIQLHCFQQGSGDVARHLAFRDYLRERPGLAAAYDDVKRACARRHPLDSHAYTDCKNGWIRVIELEAIDWLRRQPT